MTHNEEYILYYSKDICARWKARDQMALSWSPDLITAYACSWGCRASLLPLQGEPRMELIVWVLSSFLKIESFKCLFHLGSPISHMMNSLPSLHQHMLIRLEDTHQWKTERILYLEQPCASLRTFLLDGAHSEEWWHRTGHLGMLPLWLCSPFFHVFNITQFLERMEYWLVKKTQVARPSFNT